MTYTITCQNCKEEFTAKSKQAKNCPECKALLDQAMRKNAYGAVKEAITELVADENLTPAERREAMAVAINEGHQAYMARRQKIADDIRRRKEQRQREDEMWRTGQLWRCPDCGEVASAQRPCSCVAVPVTGTVVNPPAEDERYG